MSLSTVHVWATKLGLPCTIESDKTLFVYVLNCDGKVFEWCGTKYVGMPTKCGYLEVKLPPGCYVIGAAENPNGIPPLGNHLTHIAIVRVNCGAEVCVTLFNPTMHHCSTWLKAAATRHLAVGGQVMTTQLNAAMKTAVDALGRVEALIAPDPFTEAMKKIEFIPKNTTAPKASKGKAKKGRK